MKQAESGKLPECIFCDAVNRKDDPETLVAYRGKKVFVILNRYPYTSGHVMIVPYAHVGDLGSADPEALVRNDASCATRRSGVSRQLQARRNEYRHEHRARGWARSRRAIFISTCCRGGLAIRIL